MSDVEYAIQTLPQTLLRWVVSQARSRSATPEQLAAQFIPNENDPRRAIIARGLAQLAKLPENRLPSSLR
jgi:hypothetical protein